MSRQCGHPEASSDTPKGSAAGSPAARPNSASAWLRLRSLLLRRVSGLELCAQPHLHRINYRINCRPVTAPLIALEEEIAHCGRHGGRPPLARWRPGSAECLNHWPLQYLQKAGPIPPKGRMCTGAVLLMLAAETAIGPFRQLRRMRPAALLPRALLIAPWCGGEKFEKVHKTLKLGPKKGSTVWYAGWLAYILSEIWNQAQSRPIYDVVTTMM